MKTVIRTFFLTLDEAKALHNIYISQCLPHFELEDGTIMYGYLSYGEVTEVRYARLLDDNKFPSIEEAGIEES